MVDDLARAPNSSLNQNEGSPSVVGTPSGSQDIRRFVMQLERVLPRLRARWIRVRQENLSITLERLKAPRGNLFFLCSYVIQIRVRGTRLVNICYLSVDGRVRFSPGAGSLFRWAVGAVRGELERKIAARQIQNGGASGNSSRIDSSATCPARRSISLRTRSRTYSLGVS